MFYLVRMDINDSNELTQSCKCLKSEGGGGGGGGQIVKL